MAENWRPIIGCPGYEISDLGRARSVARVVTRQTRWGALAQHRVRGRTLRLGTRSGYPLASLHVGDTQVTVYVHQEVMRAFGPPAPFAGALVRHLDDVRGNCSLANLAWGSQSDNMADAKRNGRMIGGYRPKGCKVAA